MERLIIKRQYSQSINHKRNQVDTVVVTLDCGHEKHYKGHQEPKTDVVRVCFYCNSTIMGLN